MHTTATNTTTDTSHTSVQESQHNSKNSSEIIKYTQPPNSPFTICETEQGRFLAIGSLRLRTEEGKLTFEDMIMERDWNLITDTIAAVVQILQEKIQIK